jgi:hypothetical protein
MDEQTPQEQERPAEAGPRRGPVHIDIDDLKSQPREPLSDDPAVEAMGELKVGELREIVDDPDHPDHELAKEYSRLQGERIREIVSPGLKKITSEMCNAISASWSKHVKVPDLVKPVEIPSVQPAAHTITDHTELVDRDWTPAPDPTLKVIEEQRATNDYLVEANKRLTDLYKQARDTAERGQEDTKSALNAAWAGVWIGIGSALVAIVGVVVALVVSS